MESVELNQNVDHLELEELSADHLLSNDSSDTCGVFGEPELVCRVGDEYQVEIPALITKDEYDSYLKSPIDEQNKDHVPFDFWLGQLVPVTCINNIKKVMKVMKYEKQEFSSRSTVAFDKNARAAYESVRDTIGPCQGSCYGLVPGISGVSWNDIEQASFLLGLYIFRKDFAQLKTFVGSKKMEDILLFYYGKFYRSVEYNRWSICRRRRAKSRKCVYGQWIFSGLRRQKLLSRLLPQVSEESQKALNEVSNTFADGDLSLTEYVTSLKSMVGLKNFVEAVAIGKGKQDLTDLAIEPVRSSQVIPIGKECSTLTRAEIVKFLTGGFRLSKARSSDLFWEAVWPRLLARGWHSEQPKNQTYVPGANSLVFLTPGVKKFSRRRLVKGNHYFESVTDVLNKVGSEPELLMLDTEKNEGMENEENGWIEEIKEQENMPEKRHFYLQPQTPSRDVNDMKCTIVDTSLANGKLFEIRELKTLAVDISTMKIPSKESDQHTSEVSTNESDCSHKIVVDQEINSTTHVKVLYDRERVFERSSSDQVIQVNDPDSLKPVKKAKNQSVLYDNKHTGKPVKSHLCQKLKRNDLDSLASVIKRHRSVPACSNEEISYGRSTSPLVPGFGEGVSGCCLDNHDSNNNPLLQVASSQDRMSFTNLPKESPPQSNGGTRNDNHHGPENSQARMLIDLNLPQQPVDFPNGVFMTNLTNMQTDFTKDLCAPKTSADTSVPEQPANMNSRRQSSRNRPPTARMLEALVNGYLTTTKKRKNDSDAHDTVRSRPPRRSHVQVAATGLTTNDQVIAGKSETDASDGGNLNMFDKLQVLFNGNGPQISNL